MTQTLYAHMNKIKIKKKRKCNAPDTNFNNNKKEDLSQELTFEIQTNESRARLCLFGPHTIGANILL
jgi:thermostable 8-oxoguanine DNA glycosylase